MCWCVGVLMVFCTQDTLTQPREQCENITHVVSLTAQTQLSSSEDSPSYRIDEVNRPPREEYRKGKCRVSRFFGGKRNGAETRVHYIRSVHSKGMA